jgi:hypothetical protein
MQCHTVNPFTAHACLNCGAALFDESGENTTQTRFVGHAEQFVDLLKERKAFFSRNARLVLLLPDKRPLSCDLTTGLITLGRGSADEASQHPHIDLSDYTSAMESGVSRFHARLARINATIMLEDLGALNGTSINGTRVSPHHPQMVCHGDLISLGKLTLEVVFESDSASYGSPRLG